MKPLVSKTIVYDKKWIKSNIKKKDCGYKTKCWIWKRSLDKFGYGQVIIITKNKVRKFTAHRYMYMLKYENNELPTNIVIRHQCSSPSCCNPKHMLKGSHTENYHDSIEKHIIANEKRIGIRAKNAKLTDKQVIKYRRKYAKNLLSSTQIAEKLNLARATVCSMLFGRT